MTRKVVIVGGGIAGLSSAVELLNHGFSVTLLEAKDRLGGRLHTTRHGSLTVELGAEFVHGRSKPLLDAIEAADLSLHVVPEKNQVFTGGVLQPMEFWQSIGEVIHRIKLGEPDVSFSEFIRGQELDPLLRQLVLGFVGGFHGAHPEKASAHGLLLAECAAELMQGDEQARINDGYSALVAFFENEVLRMGGTVLKHAVARAIRWQRTSVELAVEQPEGSRTIEGQAALVTVPLGVLKAGTILFEPSLPEKLNAIQNLEFGNAVKIVLVFDSAWWPDGNFGLIHAVDEPLPTWWSDPRGPLLTGWAGGPKADALVDRSPEQLRSLALQTLTRIFGIGQLEAKLAAAYTFNWAHDPYTRGAYSYIPVREVAMPLVLSLPVADTLYFAGEATVHDSQMGTVFGALESGLRAARELIAVS